MQAEALTQLMKNSLEVFFHIIFKTLVENFMNNFEILILFVVFLINSEVKNIYFITLNCKIIK